MAVRSRGQLTGYSRSLLIVDVHRRVDLGRRRLRSALLVWLIGYFRSRNSGPARPGCSPEMACWFGPEKAWPIVQEAWFAPAKDRWRDEQFAPARGYQVKTGRIGSPRNLTARSAWKSQPTARWVDGALVELVGEFVWVWAEVGELVEPLGDCAKAAAPKMRPTAVLNNNCLFFRGVGLATPK